MGAIGGVVRFVDGEPVEAIGTTISERLKQQYHFHHYDQWTDHQQVYFGCGISLNTPESEYEQLPRQNTERNLLLTADAIIDNRDELISKLLPGNSGEQQPVITDSELILRAYEKWGHSCPQYLIGDFTFVIWDSTKQELFVARDHMGTRTIYYTYEAGVFTFCTVEQPLLGVGSHKAELNEKWLADFLAIDGIPHQIMYEETVYQGVLQLLPAHSAVITRHGISITKYWDPLTECKPIRFATDEEYVQKFNEVFAEAVACRTRSAGETAIMLSGGMDSGSIACVAARQMQEGGRSLYAFSSIPTSTFREQPDNKKNVYNESQEVELVGQAYPNITITYCSFDGNNSFTDIDELMPIFAQPYKIFQNMSWYHPMLKQAAEQNCRIMLNGQVGNSTISSGDFSVQLTTYYRQGQWGKVWQEIRGLSQVLQVPVRKVMKLAFQLFLPYKVRRYRDQRRVKSFDRFQNVLVKNSLIPKWDLEKRLTAASSNLLTQPFLDYEEDKKLRMSPLHFTHIGAIETKLSLANGITIRDPSRDKRIMEYCFSIPSDQFVRNGHERYLLRRAMKGILPEPIRTNNSKRGIQSADWMHRLNPVWDKLQQELSQVMKNGGIAPYMEEAKVEQMSRRLKETADQTDELTLRQALITIILGRFVQDFQRKYQANNHEAAATIER